MKTHLRICTYLCMYLGYTPSCNADTESQKYIQVPTQTTQHIIEGTRNFNLSGNSNQILISTANEDPIMSPASEVSLGTIKSDLKVPAVVLERSDMLQKIADILAAKGGISSVALVGVVGMGGVGKTVLSRQFAQLSTYPVIWELNAETKDTLIGSFQELAYASAQTHQHKQTLKTLLAVSDIQDRHRQLLTCVQAWLKDKHSWLLIYDNVETMGMIADYFPQDPDIWGAGKVILTTRNNSIAASEYIHSKSIIHVDALSEEEKLLLLCTIVYGTVPEVLNVEQRTSAIEFLKNIPSFPLDVTTAASYLKMTDSSFEAYLDCLKTQNPGFNHLQESLAAETGRYHQIRSKIITTSLNQLVRVNKNFEDLLLLVSLLDSQDIPRKLLDACKPTTIVDEFIYNLKKYSLLTRVSHSTLGTSFSVHRSTQAVMLEYCKQGQTLRASTQHVLSAHTEALDAINGYAMQLTDTEDFSGMKAFVRHLEVFLSHKVFLSKEAQAIVSSKLGNIYHYLGQPPEALELLESSYQVLKKQPSKYSSELAYTMAYLGTVYRNAGAYEQAEKLLKQSLRFYLNSSTSDQNKVALILRQLGDIYRCLGYFQKADESLCRNLDIYLKYFPNNYACIAKTIGYQGLNYRMIGEYERAEAAYQKCMEMYSAQIPNNYIGIVWAVGLLGDVSMQQGNLDRAQTLFEYGLSICKEHAPNHHYIPWTLLFMGTNYMKMGKYPEARNTFNTCISIYNSYQDNLLKLSWIYLYLGQLDLLENKFQDAEYHLRKALVELQETQHHDTYIALESLGDLYTKKYLIGRNEHNLKEANVFKNQALNYLKESLTFIKKHFPPSCIHIKRIETKLEGLRKDV